jgi:hypothetical protein
MGSIGGQSNGGEYSLNQGALRILYSLVKDTIPALAADGFTQSNPPVVTTAAAVSTTWPNKLGVLGGSVAFTRVDVGANTVGGPVKVSSAFVNLRPVGLFINDALGNAFENTPAVASGKCPYIRGGSVGVKLYETQQQTTSNNYLAMQSEGRAMGRAQYPEDLVGAVMFLSSSASDYMTGQTMNVDGGKSMH